MNTMTQFVTTAIELKKSGHDEMAIDYQKKNGESGVLLITLKELTPKEYEAWEQKGLPVD